MKGFHPYFSLQVELVILPRSIVSENPQDQQNQPPPPPPPPPQSQDSPEDENQEEDEEVAFIGIPDLSHLSKKTIWDIFHV